MTLAVHFFSVFIYLVFLDCPRLLIRLKEEYNMNVLLKKKRNWMKDLVLYRKGNTPFISFADLNKQRNVPNLWSEM
jgi:hypothetical protein